METNEVKNKCGFCGESIPADAGRCQYCGSLLNIKIDDGNTIIETPQSTGVNESTDMAESTNIPHSTDMSQSSNANVTRTEDIRSNMQVKNSGVKKPLSNGMKVFLTVLFTIVPGIGQLVGIITGIVFMNADDDADRKSFGVAILVASLIMFVVSCLACFVMVLVFSINQSFMY